MMVRKIRRLENYCDWNQSACQLGGADYGDLDMLNAKIIHTGTSPLTSSFTAVNQTTSYLLQLTVFV